MNDKPLKKLIFIYNADSGFRNMVIDGVHKIWSPATYECSLCDITYGALTEKKAWKKFRKETDLQLVFLHKDEFAAQYRSKFGYKYTFPIVLGETEMGLAILIKTEELNDLNDPNELIGLVVARTKPI